MWLERSEPAWGTRGGQVGAWCQGHQRPFGGPRILLCVMRQATRHPQQPSSAAISGKASCSMVFILCTDAFLTHGAPLFPTKPFYSEEQKSIFLPGSQVIPCPLFDPNDLQGFSFPSLPAPASGSLICLPGAKCLCLPGAFALSLPCLGDFLLRASCHSPSLPEHSQTSLLGKLLDHLTLNELVSPKLPFELVLAS